MARDQLLDHQYDGIQEYDNPCPGWWHAIFLLTVLFSVLYFLFFHLGSNGWTLAESWNSAAAEDQKQRFGTMGELKNDTATILKYKDDANWMLYAKSVFLTNCQSCHGPDGSGVVGPNLTDDYYKNIKKITDIANVINNGAAGGSMPAWRTRLHPNEIILMAAYVAGLRGKNLKGRGPEGEKIEPWPSSAAEAPGLRPSGRSMPAWRTRLHTEIAYVAGLRGKNLTGFGPEGEKIDPWPSSAAETAGPQPSAGIFVEDLEIPFQNTAARKPKSESPPLPAGEGRGEGGKK